MELKELLRELIKEEYYERMLIEKAYECFIFQARTKCRTETIVFYDKKWKILNEKLRSLNIKYIDQINRTIYDIVIFELKKANYKNSTINKFMDLLKQIIKVNHELKNIKENTIKGIPKLKEDKPRIEIIRKNTEQKILDELERNIRSEIDLRNAITINLLYDTGMRINELVNVKYKNISLSDNYIYLEHTKNHDGRYVYFRDRTKELIERYTWNHKEKDYLLKTIKGEPITRKAIYEQLNKIKRSLKIEENISPHKWRHSFATKLIENNVNLYEVMEVMGHKELSTTKRYLHLTNCKIKKDIIDVLEHEKKEQ